MTTIIKGMESMLEIVKPCSMKFDTCFFIENITWENIRNYFFTIISSPEPK